MAELGPYMLAYKGWKIRVYRAIWNAIQQHWKAERWIRVTDDQQLAQYIQINGIGIDPNTGQPTLVNAVGSLDVDIIMDEGPDSITSMQETNETLQQVLPAVAPLLTPGKASSLVDILIETSALPSDAKKKYRDQAMAEENAPPQVPPEVIAEQQKAEVQLKAAAAKADSDIKTNEAKAQSDIKVKQITAAADLQMRKEEHDAEMAMMGQKHEREMDHEKLKGEMQIGHEKVKSSIQLGAKQEENKIRAQALRQSMEPEAAIEHDFADTVKTLAEEFQQSTEKLAEGIKEGMEALAEAILKKDEKKPISVTVTRDKSGRMSGATLN
jgi:hypothetical protein